MQSTVRNSISVSKLAQLRARITRNCVSRFMLLSATPRCSYAPTFPFYFICRIPRFAFCVCLSRGIARTFAFVYIWAEKNFYAANWVIDSVKLHNFSLFDEWFGSAIIFAERKTFSCVLALDWIWRKFSFVSSIILNRTNSKIIPFSISILLFTIINVLRKILLKNV